MAHPSNKVSKVITALLNDDTQKIPPKWICWLKENCVSNENKHFLSMVRKMNEETGIHEALIWREINKIEDEKLLIKNKI